MCENCCKYEKLRIFSKNVFIQLKIEIDPGATASKYKANEYENVNAAAVAVVAAAAVLAEEQTKTESVNRRGIFSMTAATLICCMP